ncbi:MULTISPECIES: helix-turn-helix transcriptional regulator [unclassified Micromonospora]|uniref:helix-turn-helix domain-containing protein n=1 Tax=unclassified Micromonospora TaxID=2617518 RepID=UPI00332534B3
MPSGVTSESLAEKVGVDPKTVGRWLTEDRIPHPRHRLAAAEALHRDVSDIWPDTSRRRDPIWFRPWQEIEREAVSLRSYESVVLPGLLRTEAYARAVLTGGGLFPRGDVERHLAARLARQGILRQDEPPQFTAVVDEAALRRPVGGPATMREQLRALVTACAEPHVRRRGACSSTGSPSAPDPGGGDRAAATRVGIRGRGKLSAAPDDPVTPPAPAWPPGSPAPAAARRPAPPACAP